MTKTISQETYIGLEEAIRNSVYSGMNLLEEEFEENKGSAENVIAFVMGDIQSHLGIETSLEKSSPELPLVSEQWNFSETEKDTAWMIEEPKEWGDEKKVEDESPDEVMDESDWELVKADMRDCINKEIIQVLKPRMMICDYGTDIKLVEDCVENAIKRIIGSLTD